MIALVLMKRRIGEFLELADDDHAAPLPCWSVLLRFDAHIRVQAHPFQLLAGHREAEEMMPVEGEEDRHNIGLPVEGAGQMGEMATGK